MRNGQRNKFLSWKMMVGLAGLVLLEQDGLVNARVTRKVNRVH